MATVNFNELDVVGSFLGYYDTTTTAGRRKWIAKDITCWVGWIRGVSATMAVGGYSTAAYIVYIDTDAPVIPTRVAGIIQLFADKTDDWHFVNIHTTAASANGNAWTLTTGTLLTVYGDAPQYRPIGSAYITTDPDFPGHSVIPSQSPYPAPILPQFQLPYVFNSSVSNYLTNGTISFTAQCSYIYVYTGCGEIWLSTDGSYPIKYSLSSDDTTYSHWRVISVDNSSIHNYTVIVGVKNKYAVGIIAVDTTFQQIATKKVVMHIGDSITTATSVSGQTNAAADFYKYGVSIGAAVCCFAKSGEGVVNLSTALQQAKSQWMSTQIDIAVVAIGRNDLLLSEQDFKSAYISCITTIFAMGVTTVVCRGITPNPTNLSSISRVNLWINDIVNNSPNANLFFISTDLWDSIETAIDNTHPTEIGYITMADYEVVVMATFFVEQILNAMQILRIDGIAKAATILKLLPHDTPSLPSSVKGIIRFEKLPRATMVTELL